MFPEMLTWTFALCLLLPNISSGATVNTEQKLIEHLMKNYNRQSRPVMSPHTPTNVTFGMELVQLIKVDDRGQSIISKVWIRQMWVNEAMRWNASKWGGIKFTQIDAELLWKPDIVLYNNAEESFSGSTEKYKTRILIYPDGKQYWLAPATFTSTCKIDITYFPFDRQECILKFGSWTYDVLGVNSLADSRPIITSQYKESSEWHIIATSKRRNSLKYACCATPYADVTFTIILQRKPLYYMFNVISPCFLLVATVLFGFFLPPESGERISLTITILLAVAVFLQLVSDNLPRNSDSVPLLGIFYMAIMSESALSLITTCVVLVAHYRGVDKHPHPMPRWIRKYFVDYLGNVFGIRRAKLKAADIKFTKTSCTVHPKSPDKNLNLEVIENGHYEESVISVSNGIDNMNKDGSIISRIRSIGPAPYNKKLESTLDSILQEVKLLTSNVQNVQMFERTQEEWRTLAIVLDRFFFWIFLLTSIISSVAILVPVYNKYN